MRNSIRMTLLYSAAILLPVWSAAAQTPGQCAIAPTCSELGYEQQTSDCSGQHMLKCPFDKDQVFCGGEACAADYALGSCDTSKGTCDECGGKYKYTVCKGNLTLSNGNCVCNKSCSGNYYLDSSSCSCYCGISSCGSSQYLSGCACRSCSSACGLKHVRTSRPYTDAECQAFNESECYSATSYVCKGTTYYGCHGGDMCWDEYYDGM